jgi:hypothetical protein
MAGLVGLQARPVRIENPFEFARSRVYERIRMEKICQVKVLSETHRFKRLALASCPTFLNPATPANRTKVFTTPLGRRRDLFLGDNLDLWLEATRAAV